MMRPVSESFTYTVDFIENIATSIVSLLGWRRPSDVTRLVVFGIVDSIKGCAIRTWRQVCKPVIKGLPSFDVGDAAPSIPAVV